jgi:ABC-type molybdate transport system ATPase subunit
LDVNGKQQILSLLYRVQQTFDIDMLMVSHSLSDLLLLSDYLLLLDRGCLVEQGTVGELMRRQPLHDLAGPTGVPNILSLRVEQHDHVGGITHYAASAGRMKGALREDLKVGTVVRAILPPDEIALAWAPVEYISMQNQRKGTIKELVFGRHAVYCCVDVGFDLWARVTANAVKQLNLATGKPVWCLFKTFAFDLLDVGQGRMDLGKDTVRETVSFSSTCSL